MREQLNNRPGQDPKFFFSRSNHGYFRARAALGNAHFVRARGNNSKGLIGGRLFSCGRRQEILNQSLFLPTKHKLLCPFFRSKTKLCQRLTGNRISSWEQVEGAFLSVLDPFRAVSELNTLFHSSEGTPQAIPLPVSNFVSVGHKPLQLINTKVFQRLRGIKQLSFCDWFFPGANHTRFEHSLGVFGVARQAIHNLIQDRDFRDLVDSDDLKGILLAALLHDVGHYPFAHILEQYTATRLPDDIQAKTAVSHSAFSLELLTSDEELNNRILDSWGDNALKRAVRFLDRTKKLQPLYDLLDGAIDIDKLDYLPRDALHCGVPFGSALDSKRLLGALCLVTNRSRIGVQSHAVPLVEGFMVLQHQMLSAVYWHEQVRGIICMFHGVLAYLLRRDAEKIKAFSYELKQCKTDAEGWSVLRSWIDQKGGRKKESLQSLIAPHIAFDFNSIYVPIRRYRANDALIAKEHLFNVHQAILSMTNTTASSLPINWDRVRDLHTAYFNAFKPHVPRLDKAEIVVDVPYGKGAHEAITVKEDSGSEMDITLLSHLNPSIFVRPAAFVSPIRIYVSPRVFDALKSTFPSLAREAEDQFLKGKIVSDKDEHEP